MSKLIEKRINTKYFTLVKAHLKNFELIKDTDDIQPGDKILFKEWNGKEFTGRRFTRTVNHVTRKAEKYGLQEGYCIIGF